MKRPPEGFHVTGDMTGDAVGLTPEEVAEERRAKREPVGGRTRSRGGPKPGSRRAPPVKNPFDEILKSIGLWERVKAVCNEMGVAPMELAQECKARRLVGARRKVYQMLRELGWSNVDTGKLFDKSPSTVLDALK